MKELEADLKTTCETEAVVRQQRNQLRVKLARVRAETWEEAAQMCGGEMHANIEKPWFSLQFLRQSFQQRAQHEGAAGVGTVVRKTAGAPAVPSCRATITREDFRRDPDRWVRAAEEAPVTAVDEEGRPRMILSAPAKETAGVELRKRRVCEGVEDYDEIHGRGLRQNDGLVTPLGAMMRGLKGRLRITVEEVDPPRGGREGEG